MTKARKMKRREFIQLGQALGAALLFQPRARADFPHDSRKTGSVIIIGAGAAGLAAGYLLQQQGIDFQILEASSRYGGRMKRTTEFVDFPVPLGAEWIHVAPTILKEIVNDDSVEVAIETTKYDPDLDYGLYEGEQISLEEVEMEKESKFIGSTWFDFFDDYVVPSIKTRITYDAVVESIDYSSGQVQVATKDKRYAADRVIVTVPVKVLQRDDVSFSPPLPKRKQRAIDKVRVWSGCKVFIEFSESFYPCFVAYDFEPSTAGEKLFYDAAYGQDTNQHVLGLFAVGTAAERYIELGSDDEVIATILGELDELFDGRASASYLKHVFQNWNDESYAHGAYVINDESWRVVQRLGQSVDERLFFAGDAYTDGEDWSSVHAAVRSARRAVEEMLDV